jgi:septal ring factor EnvC (AmiA/AmiB activator)
VIIHESQEEISLLREAASTMNQERAVLIEEKDELEASMSKMVSEFSAISHSISEAEKIASDAESRVRHPKCSYFNMGIWRSFCRLCGVYVVKYSIITQEC